MAWTDPNPLLFETGDILTQGNIGTYILDNLFATPHVFDFTTADLDVVNTAAETTFYTVTIPANSLSTSGSAYLETTGDALGTAGGSHVLTTRVKFGGVTHITHADNYVNVTARTTYSLQVRVTNQGATNAQIVDLRVQGSGGGGGLSGRVVYDILPVTAAIDTTVDQALLVTVQWAAAVATDSVRRFSARTLLAKN